MPASSSGRLPDVVVACVGGGSNAAGMFYPFVERHGVELVGVEAGGRGDDAGEHAATLSHGQPGVLHGSFSYVLQDDDGQTRRRPFGLRRARLPRRRPGAQLLEGRGPRAVLAASPTTRRSTRFHLVRRLEGILPALETAHAVVEAMRIAAKRPKDDVVVVCFSGRGDKDCAEVARLTAKK